MNNIPDLLLWCALLLGSSIFPSCTKINIDSSYIANYNGEAREKLLSIESLGLYLESIESKDNKIYLNYSYGHSYWMDKKSMQIVTIGIDGLWYLNDNKTNLHTEIDAGQQALSYDNTYIHSSGDIIGIVEGYTDWTFFFYDSDPITFTKELFSYDPDTIIIGVNHRGYSAEAPENTLPAYRLSRLKGFKYAETDVRFTSDGKAVLLHDNSVDRTSNGSGDICTLSYSKVRSLDFGSWRSGVFKGTVIPSFDEFLALCASIGLEPYIELKVGTKEQIHELVNMVEKYGLKERSTYISFQKSLLEFVLEMNPSARVGLLCGDLTKLVISNASSLKLTDNDVYIGSSDYSEEAIKLCRDSQIPLNVWTVNSKNEILKIDSYITGITSDCLHAGRILHEYGIISRR